MRHASLPLRLVTALTCALAWMAFTPTPASAGDESCYEYGPTGELVYVCEDPGEPGEPGEPGDPGGGGAEPSCELVPPATFCMGETPCWYKAVVTPYAPPQSPKPSPDADWKVRLCLPGPTAEAVWIDPGEPQPPTLAEQAETAFGQLAPGQATLAVNPTTRSLVTLPTWFWADGLTADTLTGSSAFGLVALATPDHLEVSPGDGSATITCAWTTTRTDACSHAYERSSQTRGTALLRGHDAYAATGEAVWTVEFEMNGTPVNIPGAPTELRGQPMDAAVWVAESQAVVIDRG